MRMEQTHTLDDLNKLKREEFFKYWFVDALTNKEMAEKFGATVEDVKRRRKELNLTYMGCGMLRVAGGPKYTGIKPTPKKQYKLKRKETVKEK